MAFEKENCESYMVLKPNEGGIFDLLQLLCSCNIEKSKFVDCPKGFIETTLTVRRVMVVSIIAQRILHFLTKPLAWVGHVSEWWLNLLSSNGNLVGLILNFLRGNLVMPDKTSATFTSIIGHFDPRLGLDKNIKHGDRRYNAALSMMAAKLSYENEASVEAVVKDGWEMEFLGFFNFWNHHHGLSSTQAFMFCDKRDDSDLIIVAIRGSEPFDADAWATDVDVSWYEFPNIGKVHSGFIKALGLHKEQGLPNNIEQSENEVAYYSIRENLRKMLKENPKAKFIVTGHSLGGALAILFPVVLAIHEEKLMLERMEGVYTYGQPRVGDGKLGEFMEETFRVHGVRYYRFVYCNDIVPRVPYDDSTFLFKHFGTCIYYNSLYHGKILTDAPNKNYFSIAWIIPKMLNAVWELIRSFTLKYSNGPEYTEGWFMIVFRVIGVIIPGLSAHGPLDYVNATRLGSHFDD